jgi:hypothetical protein
VGLPGGRLLRRRPKLGEIKGDNQSGVWHALRSAPKKAARNDSAGSSAGYSYSY